MWQILLFALSSACWCYAQQPDVRYITTGQQLADAVAEFGQTGQDMVLELASPMVSMHGASFHPWNTTNSTSTPFSSGSLTVRGNPDLGYYVLDTAMRSNLTPFFTGTAQLTLQNLVIVNMCEQTIVLNRFGLLSSSASDQGMFRRNRLQQTQLYLNMTTYGRQADVSQRIFLEYVQVTQLEPVRKLVQPLILDMPASNPVIKEITAYSIRSMHHSLPSSRSINVSAQSIITPGDPLMQSMRQAGTLMPTEYCNGTLIDPEVAKAEVNPAISPLWLAGSAAGLWHALSMAANLSGYQVPLNRPPASVMLTASAPLMNQPGNVSVINVTGPLVLMGPYGEPKENAQVVILDFLQQQDVILLNNPGAFLYIENLVLSGLAARPLQASLSAYSTAQNTTNPSTNSTFNDYMQSAFPLAVVKSAAGRESWAVNPPVWMYNVSLVLPAMDYEALLILSGAGQSQLCFKTNSTQLADQLRPEFSSFLLAAIGNGWSWIVMQSVVGWGINSSQTTFLPPPGWSPTYCSTRSLSSRTKRLIVGCTVAGVVVMVVAIVAAIALQRRKRCVACCGKATSPCRSSRRTTDTNLDFKADTSASGKPSTEQSSSASGAESANAPPSAICRISFQMEANKPLQDFSRSTMIDNDPQARLLCDMVMRSQQRMSEQARASLTQQNQVGSAETQAEAKTLEHNGNNPQPGHRSGTETCGNKFSLDSHVLLSFHQPTLSQAALFGEDAFKAARREASVLSTDGNKVTLLGVLGRGAWGTVYLGEWRGLGVALKTMVFPAEQLQQYEQRQPQQQQATAPEIAPGSIQPTKQQQQEPQPLATAPAIMEAAIAASVGHRNVVATYMYDIKPCGTAADVPGPGGLMVDESHMVDASGVSRHNIKEYKLFLVQELCGCTLCDAIQGHAHCHGVGGPVDEVAVYSLLLDIARGLQYLHSKGIVHGDLKPGNVLLKVDTSAATGIVAKLADFGLSVCIGPQFSHISGFSGGTPYYISPEVIKHHRLSPAADMYAFGVIMWEMFSCQRPWVGHTADTRAWNPAFPCFTEPNVPSYAYTALAYRCLQHDPRLRPSSQEALNELVRQIQQRS